MDIQPVTKSQLKSCFDLECFYDSRAGDAGEKGFFLPGATEALYNDIHETGFMRAISDGQGVCAFVTILPPGHPIIGRLFGNKEVMRLPGGEPDTDKVFWIAKVATRPDCRRKGFARALYEDAFDHFRGGIAMTATALSPIRNLSSESFHRSIGMVPCGEFLSGTKGHLENTVNTVWIAAGRL